MQVTQWHNCYEGGWQGIIVPEAFSHPAKMSYGLLKRILAHVKEQGWLNEGDVIVDPFGGIGSTGILGAYEGYQVVCVELEEKFVDLAKQNFDMHEHALEIFCFPYPVIIQGDSRRLCEVIEKADCIVSSPPFLETGTGITKEAYNRQVLTGKNPTHKKNAQLGEITYGQSPGQLGSMKPSNVDAIISSPPYAESLSSEKDGIDWSKTHREDGTIRDRTKEGAYKKRGTGYEQMKYGQIPSNLGNLKSGDVDCVIKNNKLNHVAQKNVEGKCQEEHKQSTIGKMQKHISVKNVGNHSNLQAQDGNTAQENVQDLQEQRKCENITKSQEQDDFWHAAHKIVSQCFQILKPGGHAIWVVKSFVRNKKIVDFPGDWQRLCESVGFKTVCVHHAMLVKETEHQTLFGHTEIKRTERKSFFRRLAESKGSPKIDYEVVLCMEKQR